MTELDWSACTSPYPMLDFLRGKMSDRKQRLFAAACYHKARAWLGDEPAWRGIEVLEQHADGKALAEERRQSGQSARFAYHEMEATARDAVARARAFASLVLYRLIIAGSGSWAARDACQATNIRFDDTAGTVPPANTPDEVYCRLIRDVFGHPQKSVFVNQWWLAWNDGAVPKMAQVIYDDRAFDRLPLLADALEDAGCDDPDILAHCRSGGEHVRGCWAVDLLLGES